MNRNLAETPLSESNPGTNLGQILQEMGSITVEQLEKSVGIQARDGSTLAEALITQGFVSQEDIAMALSLDMNLPLIDLKRHQVQQDAIRMVPEHTARKYNLVPLDIAGDALVVVMADPNDIGAIEEVAAQANMRIQPSVGIPIDIQEAIDHNYKASSKIEQFIHDLVPESGIPDLNFDMPEDLVAQAAIVRALDLIILQAVRDRASDVHIEPQESRVRVRYRVDGILHDMMSVPKNSLTPLVSRLKILAGMDITEHRRPQDGQFSVRIDNRSVDIRAATLETAHGETVVLRVLDRSETLFNLAQLGMMEDTLRKYQDMLRSPNGIILVSGPTGSGKTTTLYASITKLDRTEQNIITIEDPIEYKFNDIKQVQVNEKAGIGFAQALRAMMRLDPDVILVGEIRDVETARTAVQAALTGHLVLSSIHANDAASVPFRLMNLGVEPYLISTAVVGVVAQRMVRRVCPHCSVNYDPSDEDLMIYQHEMGLDEVVMRKGAGCNFCSNTGYLDRTGVFELLPFSEAIRNMLLKPISVSELRTQAINEGMLTMSRDGMLKVKQGITTPSEVSRKVFSVG